MTYHIYENWQAHGHTARIHRSDCSFCRNGHGVHTGAGDEHEKWHGPFATPQLTQQAVDLMQATLSRCQHCLSNR